MARGDFLRGLSEGIFERQDQLRQQQEAKDFQQKGDIVRMLTGLADKVEPDSLPMLMGHIWDTMGIKRQSSGKGLRGFLDAFSGMPNRSVEDQLGTKLKSITDSFVGPGQAKSARGSVLQANPFGAPDKNFNQMAGLQGKMVFKDPEQQKLREIEARYGAQFEAQKRMNDERFEDTLTKLELTNAARSKEKREQYERQTNLMVDRRAQTYMGSAEIQALPVRERWAAARQMAQTELMGEADDRRENMQARTETTRAAGEKLRSETTGKGSRASQISEKRLNYTMSKDRRKIEDEYTSAESTVKTLTPDLEDAEKALADLAKQFGKTPEQLKTSKYASMGGLVTEALSRYNKAKKARDDAQTVFDTKKRQLDDFDKENPQAAPKTATPPPKATKGGAPAPVPQNKQMGDGHTVKVPMIDSTGKATEASSYADNQEVTPKFLKGKWTAGEVIEENGKKYRVLRRKQ